MRINIYLRKYVTKKGERRYYLIVREIGHKDRTVQLGCVTRKEAEQRRIITMNELLNGAYKHVSEKRVRKYFSEFCDKFITDFAVGNRASATVKQYRANLEIVKEVLEGRHLDEVRQYDIERFFGSWQVKGRTKNIMLSTLRLLFEKALEWEDITVSPVHNIKRFRELQGQGSHALKLDELAKLLSEASPWVRSIVTVLIYSGLRKKEISMLKFSDINWETKKLRVISTKNGKKRDVPICAELEKELRHLEQFWPNHHYKCAPGKAHYLPRTKEQGEYVFCHKDGKPCQSLSRSIYRALKKAGIEGVSMHGFRKTFCTLLARQKVHPKVAQRLMGHSDVKLTMDVYTEVEEEQLTEATNSLPSLKDIKKQRQDMRVGML
jgi:integrase